MKTHIICLSLKLPALISKPPTTSVEQYTSDILLYYTPTTSGEQYTSDILLYYTPTTSVEQ